MKKTFFLLLILFALKGFSQSNNVQTAADFFKKKEIIDAKTYIDLAAANASTANHPKMWYFRGCIYFTIQSDTVLSRSDADAIEKAAVSFMNCLKTDTKENYTEECKDLVWRCGVGLFDKAIDAYNKNDYERAIRFYNLVFDIFPLDANNNLKRNNITPEILNKNLYFAAYKTKDYEKAKGYLQKLIDAKYNEPLIYIYMVHIYLEQKDTTKALSYIEQGRKLFEDNTVLLSEEINIYKNQGRVDVLINKFTEAIKVSPDNELLYYNRGVLHEDRKELDAAIADYKKAIELKTDYFNAFSALGMILFNQGAEMANAANNIKSDKEYQKAKAAADAKLKESGPYLEKAMEINPKDKETLKSLKQLYVRTNEMDKYNKVKTALENLK